jgi:hypothetical protein
MNYTQKVVFVVCASLGVLVVLLIRGTPTLDIPGVEAKTRPQDRPVIQRRIIPAIDQEGGGRQVQIQSMNQPDAPVRLVQGTMFIGERAYGNGFMEFKNVSKRTLYYVRGEWVFQTTKSPVSTDWNLSRNVVRGGWKPGQTITVPIGAPYTSMAKGPDVKLRSVSVRMTGAVFADGTVWGEAGGPVLESVKAENASWYALVLSVLDACSKFPPHVVEQLLIGGKLNSGILPQGFSSVILRKALLDENNHLRSDAMDILRDLKSTLENPFQQQ